MGACQVTGGRRHAGLIGDESGSTAIEYALIAAVVAIFALAGLQAFGTETGVLFGTLDAINAAIIAVLGG